MRPESPRQIKHLRLNSLNELTGNFFAITGKEQGIWVRMELIEGTGNRRDTFKLDRSAAMAEWRQLAA